MDRADIERLPKAVLHDHLDGGLRPLTVLELADECGYTDLPHDEVAALASWFHQGESGSLESYLAAFDQTVAVMQTEDAISRVAYEAGIDLAADGVVYAEIRYAPSLSTREGLTNEAVLEAMIDGCHRAEQESDITIYTIATALRHQTDSVAVATSAARYVGRGVVGFDLAGPEKGYPADDHAEACSVATRAGLGLTIHAGESDGPNSMWRAVALCGAQRVGHGTQLVQDVSIVDGRITSLGQFATRIRDHRVPLEVAVTSNLHTGAFGQPSDHPFGALHGAGFNVSINTDNRLMSGVTMSDEYSLVAETFGLDADALLGITVAAIESGFGNWDRRRDLIKEIASPLKGRRERSG